MPHPLFKDYSDTESNLAEIPETEEEGDDKTSELTKAVSSTPATTSILKWSGVNKKTPLVHFSAQVLLLGIPQEHRTEAEKYHLSYKFVKTECKLVRSILNSHSFREVHPNSSNFNLMWTGSHLKPHTLRGMQDFQKINHFPRSYELTRKDRLYKNIQRMQHSKGFKHFDFIPNSFVLPEEYNEFHAAFLKDRSPWIVKPVASSRGRGIFLVNHPSQVPLDEHLLVCKYIPNPLLIDGFKFDVRLYVGVTSYDPLRIYLYEEGLSRFATVKYDRSGKNIRNTCMHLTNYSVNKKSENFISCQDPEVEDYGTKWSMSAMLRYLKAKGMDTTALMMRIEDVVVKTIVAGEMPIASACKMFMPFPGNCFEIYGFDILIDENLRPWLLEVNLSPSLACDSPLDLKIKSHLVTDMFNLIGFVAHDPLVRRPPSARRVPDYSANRNRYQRQRAQSAGAVPTSSLRPNSAARRKAVDDALTLTPEETRVLRHTKEEYTRRGGFVRIFPTSESWELYGSFLEHRTTHNHMLHSKLFPHRKASLQSRPSTASLSSATARAKSFTTYKSSTSVNNVQPELSQPILPDELSISLRISCYERKLDSWTASIMRPRSFEQRNDSRPSSSVGTPSQMSSMQPCTGPAAHHPLSSQSHATRPSHEAISARTKPEGEPDKPVMEDPLPTKEEKPALTRSPYEPRPMSAPRAQSAKDASRPPRSQASQETVSKRALSAQPRFKAVRVDDIMEKSAYLTKLQARQAFAMYLQRVQQRLIQEASYDSNDADDSSRHDEQMTLVIRFLKKAACNLQQPFKVVIPSRKLPLHDRRRILAKQLGDFVHIYGKETAQIQRRQDVNRAYGLLRTADMANEIPDEEFKVFMAIASETELEDILTRYTKLNKNASVFLGGKSDHTTDEEERPNVTTETGLQRKKQMEGKVRTFGSSTGERSWTRSREDLSTTTSPGAMVERHARAVTAVSAYGTSIAINKTRQRPASARAASLDSDSRPGRPSRPFSAKPSRSSQEIADGSDESLSRERLLSRIHQKVRVLSASAARQNATDGGDADLKGNQFANEQAVAAALQRLAKRQSTRNYSSMSTTGLNGHNWSDLFKQMDFSLDTDPTKTADGFVSLISPEVDAAYKARDSQVTSKRSHDRNASANATFNSFVDYRSDSRDNHVTDPFDTETAVHKHTGSEWKSIRVDLPKEHKGASAEIEPELEKHSEQKRSVSREDYNRHIRLLSQKLSEEKLREHAHQAQNTCLPRPPPGPSPGKKMVNAKRIARLAASNPHLAFDFVTGSPNSDSHSLDAYS